MFRSQSEVSKCIYLMMMQVKKKINMMMMTVIIQHLSQNMRMFVTEILQKCSRR